MQIEIVLAYWLGAYILQNVSLLFQLKNSPFYVFQWGLKYTDAYYIK